MTEASLLLLSGAGLDTQLWDPLRAHVRRPVYAARGYPITPVPGDGRLVVVAHSGAGVWLRGWVHTLGARVAAVVTVGALVPPPGGRFVDALPLPMRWVMPTLLRVVGTRPPDAAIRRDLCEGLDEVDVDAVLRGFTPEPLEYYLGRAPSHPLPTVHTRAIVTTRDRAVAAAVQRAGAARLPGAEVVELDSGHLPMRACPDRLAALIDPLFGTVDRPDLASA